MKLHLRTALAILLMVAFSVDMTAAQFLIEPDVPPVHAASLTLIQKWKAGRRRAPATLDDVPRITFRVGDVELNDFLSYIIQNPSPQETELGLYPYATSNALVLRPGPPVVECRAYRLDKARLTALSEPADAYDPELVTALFADRPWETNRMAWVDGASILIKIDTPDRLEHFDKIIEFSGAGRRMQGEPQQESGHLRK